MIARLIRRRLIAQRCTQEISTVDVASGYESERVTLCSATKSIKLSTPRHQEADFTKDICMMQAVLQHEGGPISMS
jgi:hypothetical protein